MSTPPGSKLVLLIPKDQVGPVRASIGALMGCNAVTIQMHNYTNEHIATITVAAHPNKHIGQIDYVEGFCKQGDEIRVLGYAAPMSEEEDHLIGIRDVERVATIGSQVLPTGTREELDREQMSEILETLTRIEIRLGKTARLPEGPPFPGYSGSQIDKLEEIIGAFLDGVDLRSNTRQSSAQKIEKAVHGILELAILRVREDFSRTVDDGK